MTKIVKIVQNDRFPVNITWIINNICTNKCSYCPSNLHDGKNHHYNWENAKKFLEILFKKFDNIHCSISGGEPSISPFFPELVKMFKENGSTVGLTSNAAKTSKFWEDISPYLNYICFSWHPEFIDNEFDSKILAAAENTPVTVRVMMHPKYWEHSISAFEKYYRMTEVDVEAVRILNWVGDSDKSASEYTDEQLNWFLTYTPRYNQNKSKRYSKLKIVESYSTFHFIDGLTTVSSSPINFINEGLTNFFGYKCEIGQKELFIDWTGNVRPGNCSVGGIIGNINDPENIQWPTEPYTCDRIFCHCPSDVLVNKWR